MKLSNVPYVVIVFVCLNSFNQSINQYLLQTAYITLSHSIYKIDIGYSLGWHQRYETCQGCNPLKFHKSDIYI